MTAWCVERSLGSGLSADAVRLSAKLLLEVPLPTDRRAWTWAAKTCASRARCRLTVGRPFSTTAASAARPYRVPDGEGDAPLAWWSHRLP